MTKIEILKKRKDFVRVAKGFTSVMPTVILQAAQSLCAENSAPKVGYTTSKKIGKAHIRNKARRRMRAAVAEVFSKYAMDNFEYVLVGRYNTSYCPFDTLKQNLIRGLKAAQKEFQNNAKSL